MDDTDVGSLAQAEAETRAALLEVDRYDISIDLTHLVTGPDVRVVSTVTFRSRDRGAETFVDCAAEVVSATLNGSPVAAPSGGRIRLTDLRDENVLVVESVQSDTAEGAGVHKAVDPADGEIYLWTSFEPDEARFVWACFDQPDLKAPHAFTVLAPSTWSVVSNSGDPSVEQVADGVRRWAFADTPPLSTYNPVVLAGPFVELRREEAGYDLGLFTRRSLASVLERDADDLFTVTGQGLTFYGKVFGLPFPQRKYDQVFLPEFGGAMENYGAVAWSDGFLSRTPPTAAEQSLLARVLLHEMAHMWFGNMVTMRWWDDLWLNEAFAEFACNWAAASATRYDDAWAVHLASDKQDAYLADQGPISHPIRQPVATVADAASIFDDITYPKGASVLQQLMVYVGEEVFSAGMTDYFSRHAWGNTTLQDLVDALARASGRDLDRWRRGWLETAGPDRLTLEQREDGGLDLVTVALRGGEARPHRLLVGAYARRDGVLERTAVADVEVEAERTTVDLPADADLYLVNDDDLTFATARPSSGTRDALFTSAAQLPTPLARGVAVATTWDMLTNGEASTAETVRSILSVLRAETSASVFEAYVDRVCDGATLWSSGAVGTELAAEVAATCRELAADPTRRQVTLRGLARVATGEDLEWLERNAGDDVDLTWRILGRRAEVGTVSEEEVAALQERDPDPDSWVRALGVAAARPTAEAKETVWQAVAVDRKVPVSSIRKVMVPFMRPGQDELLAPYAERYLELLPSLDRGGMIPAMSYTFRLFPLHGIDLAYIDRAIAAAGGAAPVVRQTLLQQADLVRRMLLARGQG